MKKKISPNKLPKDSDSAEDKATNIHHVRRKIEDILLEREQKKLLEL